MGGKGSGGARLRAGRPRKSQAEGALTGSRRTRARAKAAIQNGGNQNGGNQNRPVSAPGAGRPAAAEPPGPSVSAAVPPAPDRLTLAELDEWNWLAPLAFKAGKLTEMDVPAMVDLCQRRVLYRQLLSGAYSAGLEQVAPTGGVVTHPHVAKLTSLAAKIDALMDKFGLSPAGRQAESPDTPADPFAEFDAGGLGADGATVN